MLRPKIIVDTAEKQIALDSGKDGRENRIETKDTTSETNYSRKIQLSPIQEFEIRKPLILAEVQIQEVSLEREFRVYFLPAKLK